MCDSVILDVYGNAIALFKIFAMLYANNAQCKFS